MINCKNEVMQRIKSAKPGDPSVLVSLEALEALPEIYSATIVAVPFAIPRNKESNEDWSVVATYPNVMYMPTVNLLSRIADARGVSGLDNGSQKQVIQLIDWNRVTMKYDAPPQLVNYPVGYEVVKQGSVMQEDGTERISDPAIILYNVFERCNELWTKEESATENYTKCTVSSNGSRLYTNKYGKQETCKYDSQSKRMAHLAGEMKFAEVKANMKARNLVIRTLCGLQTGYNIDQLAGGCFYVGKILRSNFAIKSEHAARLAGLSKNTGATEELYGYTTPQEEPLPITESFDIAPEEPEAVPVTPALTRELAIKKIEKYFEFNLVDESKKESAQNLLNWLKSDTEAEKNERYWARAVEVIGQIESELSSDLIVK